MNSGERGSENTKNGDCGTKTRILDVNITSTILTTGNELIPERENCYFHLVGGPEAEKKNGVPKWNVREAYSKYPNSEMELAEFLKSLQKGK